MAHILAALCLYRKHLLVNTVCKYGILVFHEYKLKVRALNIINSERVCCSLQVQFGMVFDVDGVVTRGPDPLDAAKRMFKRLAAGGRQLKVPLAFVTNGSGLQKQKAATLSTWFEIDVRTHNYAYCLPTTHSLTHPLTHQHQHTHTHSTPTQYTYCSRNTGRAYE